MKITAFNVKEDLEEGHFDAAGNFIFDKVSSFCSMFTYIICIVIIDASQQ